MQVGARGMGISNEEGRGCAVMNMENKVEDETRLEVAR